jgi:hypothetical protein
MSKSANAGRSTVQAYTNASRLPLVLAVACASLWGCAIPAERTTGNAEPAWHDAPSPTMFVPPSSERTAPSIRRNRGGARARASLPVTFDKEVAAQPLVYGATMWSGSHGAAAQNDYIDAVTTTGSGDIVVAGGFQGLVDVGCGTMTATGTNDMFIASYSSTGLCVWSKRFGGTSDTYPMNVVVDSTNAIYVSGYYSGRTDFGGGSLATAGGYDGFVLKLSSSGVYTWADSFGGASDETTYGLAVVSDSVYGPMVVVGGNFLTTANFGGVDLTSAGDSDGFVAAYLASTGAHTWSRRLGGAGYDSVNALAYHGSSIVIVGTATGSIDLGVGATTSFGAGDALVAAYDVSGSALWSTQYGGSGADDAYAVAIDPNANIHVTGLFSSSASFGGTSLLTGTGKYTMFTAQYTSSGAYAWAQSLDSANEMDPLAITVDSIGTTYVTGAYSGTLVTPSGTNLISTGFDAFVAAYAPSTTAPSVKWLRSYAGPGTEVGSSITVSPTGSLLVGGYFDSSIDFGAGPVAATGASDMFLLNASTD